MVYFFLAQEEFYSKIISTDSQTSTETGMSLGGLWIFQHIISLALKAPALIYKVKRIFYHFTHF